MAWRRRSRRSGSRDERYTAGERNCAAKAAIRPRWRRLRPDPASLAQLAEGGGRRDPTDPPASSEPGQGEDPRSVADVLPRTPSADPVGAHHRAPDRRRRRPHAPCADAWATGSPVTRSRPAQDPQAEGLQDRLPGPSGRPRHDRASARRHPALPDHVDRRPLALRLRARHATTQQPGRHPRAADRPDRLPAPHHPRADRQRRRVRQTLRRGPGRPGHRALAHLPAHAQDERPRRTLQPAPSRRSSSTTTATSCKTTSSTSTSACSITCSGTTANDHTTPCSFDHRCRPSPSISTTLSAICTGLIHNV